MAYVAHGAVIADAVSDVTAFLIGTTRGKIAFRQRATNPGLPNPVADAFDGDVFAEHVEVSVAEAPKVAVAHGAILEPLQAYSGIDWFEKVHVLPRTTIEFGNIITTVTETYEVYSTFVSTTVTLSSVVNGAAPGVELPDLTVPRSLLPQSSILDPTSTSNDAGTGLGTIVPARIIALPTGIPTFSAEVEFDFASPSNDVSLFVSGTRIVLITHEYEVGLRERLSFLTDVVGPTLSGQEYRASVRKQPRQSFDPLYSLDDDGRRTMMALVLDWLGQTFGFPLWGEQLRLTAPTIAGATQYQVTGADDVDLRVGGYAAVIQDDLTFDVLRVTAKTSTLITAADPATNGYPIGTRIMPMRTVVALRGARGSRPPVNLGQVQLELLVTDNDTGALAGSATPGFWSTLGGRVILSDPNIIAGDLRETWERAVYDVDGQTGLVHFESLWDKSRRRHQRTFVLRSRADLMSFRRLLLALGGRQKAFWIPTFADDLVVVDDVSIGGATVDVESIGYVRFVRERHPMRTILVTFTDGSQLTRSILSSATISATVERLTLDSTWPANRTVDEFERVSFVALVRFDADEFTITHERIGLARCEAPLVEVFDDD